MSSKGFSETLTVPSSHKDSNDSMVTAFNSHFKILNTGLMSVGKNLSTMHTKVGELEVATKSANDLKYRVDTMEKTLTAHGKILADIRGMLNDMSRNQQAPANTTPQAPPQFAGHVRTAPAGSTLRVPVQNTQTQSHSTNSIQSAPQVSVTPAQSPLVTPQILVTPAQSPLVTPQASVTPAQSPLVTPQILVTPPAQPQLVNTQVSVTPAQSPLVNTQVSVTKKVTEKVIEKTLDQLMEDSENKKSEDKSSDSDIEISSDESDESNKSDEPAEPKEVIKPITQPKTTKASKQPVAPPAKRIVSQKKKH